MPSGYQRAGKVLLLRLPEELRPYFEFIGRAWQKELGVATVLRYRGPVQGEWRLPQIERIAGSETETEVVEHGIRYRFDAARILFARGNRTERVRIGELTRPGETVVDLFAGIGYFTLPAAVKGRAAEVWACEKNPTSFAYLVKNLELNSPTATVRPLFGDNRRVAIPLATADRVVLGYLPSSLPWLGRALSLLRPQGGWLHLHLVVDARTPKEQAVRHVTEAIPKGSVRIRALEVRKVKPFGPGRTHVVVDLLATA